MFEPERRSRYSVFPISRSAACPAVGLKGISGTFPFSNSISVGFGSVVFPVVSKPLDPLVNFLTSSSLDSFRLSAPSRVGVIRAVENL